MQVAAAYRRTVIATNGGTEAPLEDLGAAHVVDYKGDLAAQVRSAGSDGVTAVAHGSR